MVVSMGDRSRLLLAPGRQVPWASDHMALLNTLPVIDVVTPIMAHPTATIHRASCPDDLQVCC